MGALADVTNTKTPTVENTCLSLTVELSEHLLTNGYVKIDGLEKYVLSACERGDLQLLKLVREHSKLPWDMRVAGAKCAHGVCRKVARRTRGRAGKGSREAKRFCCVCFYL